MIRRPPRSTPLSLHDALPIFLSTVLCRSFDQNSGCGFCYIFQSGIPKSFGSVITVPRSEEHTSELQSRLHLVCRLLLEKKKKKKNIHQNMKIFNYTQPDDDKY